MKPWMLVAALFAFSACNTVRGAGEDVSAAGNVVSNTAEKVEAEIEEDVAPAVNPY